MCVCVCVCSTLYALIYAYWFIYVEIYERSFLLSINQFRCVGIRERIYNKMRYASRNTRKKNIIIEIHTHTQVAMKQFSQV